jgi:hypothetical protein
VKASNTINEVICERIGGKDNDDNEFGNLWTDVIFSCIQGLILGLRTTTIYHYIKRCWS